MQQSFSIYTNRLSKYLLGLAFLWSVFLFSGYVTTEFLKAPTSPETELVETNILNTSTISFQKATASFALFSIFSNHYFYFKVALLAYNNRLKVAFRCLEQQCFNYINSTICLPLKTIPHGTEEVLLTFLR